ncbi:hypothetical protein EBU91_05365, partial [bacterium]|nr:hypothetical protein [bacterium]
NALRHVLLSVDRQGVIKGAALGVVAEAGGIAKGKAVFVYVGSTGTTSYVKLADNNKTYGLTTLRQKHLIPTTNGYRFSFVGKSNQKHQIDVPKRYQHVLSQFITTKKNDPLFYYYQSSVKLKQLISSEELNEYLKEYMGNEFTCKDIRTYSANLIFVNTFLKNVKKNNQMVTDSKVINKIVLISINESAHQLGHTKTISKKNYISNKLIDFILSSPEEATQSSSSSLLSKLWS